MCGITAILSDTSLSDDYINKIKKEFMKIKPLPLGTGVPTSTDRPTVGDGGDAASSSSS